MPTVNKLILILNEQIVLFIIYEFFFRMRTPIYWIIYRKVLCSMAEDPLFPKTIRDDASYAEKNGKRKQFLKQLIFQLFMFLTLFILHNYVIGNV